MAKPINVNTGGGRVNAFDVIFYLLLALGSLVITASFNTVVLNINIAGVFTSISFLFLLGSILAFTGVPFFQGLKVVSPAWILAAPIAFGIWTVFNAFLPFKSASAPIGVTEAGNVLVDLLGKDAFLSVFNAHFIGTVESLIFGLAINALVLIGTQNNGRMTRGKQIDGLPILVFLAGIMALAHAAVAFSFAGSGVLDFQTVIIHQFFAFFVMGIFHIVGGFGANISAHWVKNLLAYPSPFGWLFAILVWVVMLGLSFAPGQKKQITTMGVPSRV